GQLSAIGGQLSAIGGQLSAIGGQLSAIGGQLSAISVNRGAASERIETFLWQPGIYYIAVAGNNGAFSLRSYSLQLEVKGSDLATPPPAPTASLSVRTPQPQVDTLYILSSRRMNQLYPQSTDVISNVQFAINDLATRSQGRSVVLELDGAFFLDTKGNPITMGEVYAQWDKTKNNPLAANYVAQTIDNLITAATISNTLLLGPQRPNGVAPAQVAADPPYPNVKHIVLVGGDEVIPFYRIPDLTTLANEADYAAYTRGIIDSNSAQGAALRYRTMQTDNIYGADRAYRFLGYPLFIPDRAVGRLVETPEDIANYLAPYNIEGGGSRQIDASQSSRAFVAGYDFLIDQATEVVTTNQRIGFTAPASITQLIDNFWTSQHLDDAWFDERIDSDFGLGYTAQSPFALQSINAHFDHWQAIPATGTLNATFPAQRIYTPTASLPFNNSYFTDRLAYSVGCHSGFNVDDSSIASDPLQADLYRADFAQAFVRQGGNWIGNTGYGYGTLDTVDYSERLAVLLTEEFGRDVRGAKDVYVGQPIGTALIKAKQRYLRNAESLGPYDAKVLSVMTLYGLPYIPMLVPEEYRQPPPPEERDNAPANTIAPIRPSTDLGTLERVITFTLGFENITLPRTGSQFPVINNVQVDDSFVAAGFGTPELAENAVRVNSDARAGRPVLPSFAYDLTALSALSKTQQLVLKDVVFLRGTYTTTPGYNPLITQIVTETIDPLTETEVEPDFSAGTGIWYPDKFFDFSRVGTGRDQRVQLVSAAAQFRTNEDGVTGMMRPYTTMTFKVVYVDPGAARASEALADTNPPQIEQVRLVTPGTTLQADLTRVVVEVTDQLADGDPQSTGIESVEAVYIVGDQEWVQVQFQPAAPGDDSRWSADILVAASDLLLIVSASDKAGNTAFYTAKGTFAPTANPVVFLPVIRR
ncbi:MAG: peptidase, partial [Chloroflexales bacterium]|nr:peptidase [Chloroflexales bacterium]